MKGFDVIAAGGCAPPNFAARVTTTDRELLDRLRDILAHGTEAEALAALAEHREKGGA
jgi:hypothetical protein